MSGDPKIEKARRDTHAIYERQAKQFDKDRARDGREDVWLEKFVETIPDGGRILDLGCGTGEPISAWLIMRGYKLTGVDFSEPILSIARKRFPGSAWVVNDMRDLALEEQFDGILSWHGTFHLSPDEQRELLPKLSKYLKPGGTLMLTIGNKYGEITGTIGGETVYHASLDPSEYRKQLQAAGFSDIQLNTDAQEGPYVLLARK